MKLSQADTLQKSEQYFKNHLPALDLLRAISIVMVLLFHFSGSFSLPRESYGASTGSIFFLCSADFLSADR